MYELAGRSEGTASLGGQLWEARSTAPSPEASRLGLVGLEGRHSPRRPPTSFLPRGHWSGWTLEAQGHSDQMPAHMWPQSWCAHVCVCAVVTLWHGQSGSRAVGVSVQVRSVLNPCVFVYIESSLWLQNPALHLQPLPAGGD